MAHIEPDDQRGLRKTCTVCLNHWENTEQMAINLTEKNTISHVENHMISREISHVKTSVFETLP